MHDVLAGRRSIHEALQLGPAGMQIVAGSAAPETRAAVSERSIRRLLRQVQSLAPHADWLLIDAGNQPCELTARLWSAADAVLLVTAPDAVSVMDTYALIKTLLTRQTLIAAAGAGRQSSGRRAERGRRASPHRPVVPAVPWPADRVRGSGAARPGRGRGNRPPAVLADPDSPLASAVHRLARRLVANPETQAIDHRRAASFPRTSCQHAA